MLKPSAWILFALGLCGALWVALAAGQTPEPLGDDYKLNEGYYDLGPDIDMDARGDFVVVWSNGLYTYYGIDWSAWGRRFAADGRPRGEKFRLHDQWTAHNIEPEVAVAPDGRFAVVWSRIPFPRRAADLWGRFYDASGTPAVEEFPISAAGTAEDLDAADIDINPKGDFVVVWRRNQSYPGPEAPQGTNILGAFDTFGRSLRSSIDQVVAFDRQLFDLSSEETAQRKIRDDEMGFLGQRVVGLRRTVLGQYVDPNLVALGLRPPNPTEPLAFHRTVGSSGRRSSRRHTTPPSTRASSGIPTRGWARP